MPTESDSETALSNGTASPGSAASASADQEILLELVDEDGRTTGTAEKLSAHLAPGKPHRAFSVFLFDEDGRMLLQRRARSKYHSPGVWSNTCCGHPYPGEAPIAAAARRTYEELGAAPALIREAGTVRYDLPDPVSGLVEREFNHLFVGRVGAAPVPDPDEAEEVRLVDAAGLAELRASEDFSVWFPVVLDGSLPSVRELTGGRGGW